MYGGRQADVTRLHEACPRLDMGLLSKHRLAWPSGGLSCRRLIELLTRYELSR